MQILADGSEISTTGKPIDKFRPDRDQMTNFWDEAVANARLSPDDGLEEGLCP